MRDFKEHEEIELIRKYEVLSYMAKYFFNIFLTITMFSHKDGT